MTDTFTTPNGTYGGEMKPNGLFRWMMARQANSIRKGGAKAAAKLAKRGVSTLVLVTKGRKSGKTFETPAAFWTLEDGSWIVCASAGGAQKHPAWYWNIAAAPDALTAIILGEEIPVAAEELHGEARGAAWRHIISTAKNFVGYTKKTDRELPVIRLTRR